MRLFWAMIGILAAATAAVFALRNDGNAGPQPQPAISRPAQPRATPAPVTQPVETTPAPQPPATTPAPETPAPITPNPAPEPVEPPQAPAETNEQTAAPAPPPPPDDDLTAEDLNAILGITDPETLALPGAPEEVPAAPQPQEVPEESTPAPLTAEPAPDSPATAPEGSPSATPATQVPLSEPTTGETIAPPPTTDSPSAATPDAPPAEAPSGIMFNGYEVIPAVKAPANDGGLRLDDRFVLKGQGTESDPYLITWELLISAQETLVPRSGKKKIPERLTMLEGTWVEITGNIAFPLMEEQPDELLCMLNAWDGCCIGVPPTPYDAIEVRLKRPVTGTDRFASYAGMKGKFFIKPYLVGEWLVGLYVMDNADMTAKQAGADAP